MNLRSKTTDETSFSKPEAGAMAFCGSTSVCSTPLTDIKKVVYQGTMSICTNPSKEESEDKQTSEEVQDSFKTDSVNSILSAVEEKSHTSLHSIDCTEKLWRSAPYVNVGASLHDRKTFSSMFELREKLKCLTKRVTMKYYNKGSAKLNKTLISEPEESPKKERKKNCFKTITDPTFPVFRSDGRVISKSFYEAYIQTHLSLFNSELKKGKGVVSESDVLEDFDMAFRDYQRKPKEGTEIEMQPLKTKPTSKPRKSLTLPLKSLTSDSSETAETPSLRRERYTGGVQLTPLMTKLSMLAMEERSSGFCSKDTTPSEYKDLYTPSQSHVPFLKRREDQPKQSQDQTKFQKCILFVCGQQDMVVNVLLEEATSEVINKMVCVYEGVYSCMIGLFSVGSVHRASW